MECIDPFTRCPIYETKHFILRKLVMDDSQDLFQCYSDPLAAKFFNGDNCGDDFFYDDFHKFTECVRYWLRAYDIHDFVRFSIVNKKDNRVIGTAEICPSHKYSKAIETIGILRIDIMSPFETKILLKELYDVLIANIYKDFQVDFLLTKAIPKAKIRRRILKESLFVDAAPKCNIPFADYYIR